MKRHLLATTAIAAATGLVAFSGTADAAEKLKLGIGGYFQAYVGYFDADEDGPRSAGTANTSRRSFDFFREAEVHFNGEVALDNGMRVGIDVQLEAESCGDQIDESYLYFQGDFGKLVLGSENSAAYLMSYGAPAADSNFDGADPNYNPFGVGFAYAPNMTSDSEKITYFTPRFAGFGLGVSWTPDNTEDQGGATIPSADEDRGFAFGNTQSGNQENIWEFGLNYENKFGDFGILAGVTYGFASGTENSSVGVPAAVAPGGLIDADEQEQFSAGLNLTYAGFTIGGGYLWDNQGAKGSNDREVWTAGAAWANGPLRIGASWATHRDDSFVDFDVDRYSLGASYVYGPGMQLRGGVFYYDTKNNADAMYDDALMIAFGTIISF